MSLVQRAINILTKPASEWQVIAAEPSSPGGLLTGYALPLAILPAIGTILGGLLFSGMLGPVAGFGIAYFLVSAAIGIAVSLGIQFVMSIIAGALAGSFGGVGGTPNGAKVIIYSATATALAGLLSFIPIIGFLIGLAAFAYAAYLIYLGGQIVMRIPQDKAIIFTIVTILIWIVIYFVMAMIIGAIMVAIFFSAAVGSAGMMMR